MKKIKGAPMCISNLKDQAFKAIFASAPFGMAVLDQDGKVSEANSALEQLLERPQQSLCSQYMADLLHTQDREKFTNSIRRAERHHCDVLCGEVRLHLEGNNYKWSRLSVCRVSIDVRGQKYFLARVELQRTLQERAEQVSLLSVALDYTADGVLLLDEDLCISYLNISGGILLGQPRQHLIGECIYRVLSLLTPYDEEAVRELINTQRIESLEISHPTGGTSYDVSIQLSYFHYGERNYGLALIRDLSEQQRMVKALLYNERQFRLVIENTHDAIGRLTPDFRLIYANPALEALCRLPLVEAKGRPAHDAFGENSQVDIMAEMVREVARSGQSMEEELIHGITGPIDQQHHYLVQLVPERNNEGEVTSVLSIARDITSIRKAERHLADSNQQLRDLTSRRESAREDERRLIAQEIHDELGQHLTALRMGISLLRLQFGTHAAGLSERAETLMQLCDRTIQVVRSIATSLRPAALNMGLYPALQWLIGDFNQHSDIACEFTTHSEEPALSDDQATTAFRIVQEALNNVARHSGATRAMVSLERVEGFYRMDITDNGCGFKPELIKNKNSLGLVGMRERGQSLGGEVVIFSHPGQGTTVQATFPVTEPASIQ